MKVIATPGDAPDNICVLDPENRLLFSSDILLHGGIWTHMDGGSVADLAASYRVLMPHVDEFDRIMPSHGEPLLEKALPPASLAAAEQVLSGQAQSTNFIDPWGRHLKK